MAHAPIHPRRRREPAVRHRAGTPVVGQRLPVAHRGEAQAVLEHPRRVAKAVRVGATARRGVGAVGVAAARLVALAEVTDEAGAACARRGARL